MSFKTFLRLSKNKWSSLYIFTIIFIISTLICAFIIGQSITPFYVFQMYSQKIPQTNTFATYKLIINNKEFNTYKLSREKGDLLRSNFDRYLYLRENNFKDKYYNKLKDKTGNLIPQYFYDNLLHYPNLKHNIFNNWIITYVKKNINSSVKTLLIYKVEYTFLPNGKPHITEQKLKLKLNI